MSLLVQAVFLDGVVISPKCLLVRLVMDPSAVFTEPFSLVEVADTLCLLVR